MPEAMAGFAPLAEVTEINPETLPGNTASDFAFRYVDLSSAEAGSIQWKEVKWTTFGQAPSRARRITRSGDVLFGTVRPYLQSHGFIGGNETGPIIASTGFSVIRAKVGVTDENFLYHAIMGNAVAEQANQNAIGSSYPAVTERDVAKFQIFCPSVTQQSKIAEVLDTLDAAIRGTEAVVAKLKAMKQGLLNDLLTRGIDANGDLRPPHAEAPHLYKETLLGWLPKEWDVVPLGEITRELAQGWSPDCPSEEALADEWGVLKTTAVVWQGYQAHENKRLPVGLKPRPHLQVEARDILITRAGPSSRVAVVAYVPETRDKLMISDKLYRLRVLQRHNSDYVSLALGSTAVQREISKTISGMAESQTNISQATLKPLPTPLPPQSEQEHIAETIGAQSRKIAEEEQLLEKLRLQKSGLMDDLLTGRVFVTPLLEGEAAHGA